MKIIFLDIDGVLNTTFDRKHQENADAEFHPVTHLFVKRSSCALLKKICDAVPEAGIVLVSDWRYLMPPHEVFDFLAQASGIARERFCDTCSLDYDFATRSEAVEEYLGRVEWDSFVILDDMDVAYPLYSMASQGLVATESLVGLVEGDVQRAVDRLVRGS